jgi:hypothetical protein
MVTRKLMVAPNSSAARRTKSAPDVHLELICLATYNTRITDPELYMVSKTDSFEFHWSKSQLRVHKDEINKVLFSAEGQSRYVYFEGQRKNGEQRKWLLELESPEDAMLLVNLIKSRHHSIGLVVRRP